MNDLFISGYITDKSDITSLINGLKQIEIKELSEDTTLSTTDFLSLPNDNYSQFNPIFNFIYSLSLLEFLWGLGVISFIFLVIILNTSIGDDIWDRIQYRLHTGFDWREARDNPDPDKPDKLLDKMKAQRVANSKTSVFSDNQPENWRLTEDQRTELCIRYYLGGGLYYKHKVTRSGKDRLYTRGPGGKTTPCSQNMIDHV